MARPARERLSRHAGALEWAVDKAGLGSRRRRCPVAVNVMDLERAMVTQRSPSMIAAHWLPKAERVRLRRVTRALPRNRSGASSL